MGLDRFELSTSRLSVAVKMSEKLRCPEKAESGVGFCLFWKIRNNLLEGCLVILELLFPIIHVLLDDRLGIDPVAILYSL